MNIRRRARHHQHRMEQLTAQYAHLDAEQRAVAFEADVLKLSTVLEAPCAVKVLEKVVLKLRVHR